LVAHGDDEGDVHPELVRARRDPRLGFDRRAVVADWWAAIEAAERTRRLAEWGLHELARALEREEVATGHRRHDEGAPPAVRQALEAAYMRAQLAEAEISNELAELNAMTLVAMVAALDAFVEHLAPDARRMRLEIRAGQVLEAAARSLAEANPDAEPLDQAKAATVRSVVADVLDNLFPKGERRPGGLGAKRWDSVLVGAGLGPRADREIPADMDEALVEVVALRHVLAHGAGRIDSRALRDAPSLPYDEGDLVRVSRQDFRRYAAAVRTYGDEVVRRTFEGLDMPDFPLDRWRRNVPLNT
jgi:hypothetical protein